MTCGQLRQLQAAAPAGFISKESERSRQRMDEMDARAIEASENEEALESLIRDSQSFILACASKTMYRYVTASDDEWSIALLAFTEAVRSYRRDRGDFRPFAAMIIRRRLLDELYAQSAHSCEISVQPDLMDGSLEDTEESPIAGEIRAGTVQLQQREAEAALTAEEEIAEIQEILYGYGFSFYDLASCSPKAEKTRTACAEAVKTLLQDPQLMARMRTMHALPVRDLLSACGVKEKILERHRRYIIAAAEILQGDYPILGSFLVTIRKAVSSQ